MDPYNPDILWIVIVGFVLSFLVAFGIGANDVANSFGTSVGSGVLTLRSAFILATICESTGAILIGFKVSDTMRKGILDVSMYNGFEKELMLGCLSALMSNTIWLILATAAKLPISCTHSVVGATIGFSLVCKGSNGLNWNVLGSVILSWFISPLLSGMASVLLYLIVYNLIMRSSIPKRAGLRSLPIFYGLTFFINVLSILLDGPKLLYLDNIPVWINVPVSILVGLLVALIALVFIVPMEKRRIEKFEETLGMDKPGSALNDVEQKHQVAILFKCLQVLSAGFGSFAHGGNDVSNAIGPLIAIFIIYEEGTSMQEAETPIYLLVYGGVGITIGLWIWGHHVIKTIGQDLTPINPTTGFVIEVGAATTVLVASKMGLPISTTHCKVGCIVFVGHFNVILEQRRLKREQRRGSERVKSPDQLLAAAPARKLSRSSDRVLAGAPVRKRVTWKLENETPQYGVNWKLFRNILLAWIVTVPVTMLLSALFMYIFRHL